MNEYSLIAPFDLIFFTATTLIYTCTVIALVFHNKVLPISN